MSFSNARGLAPRRSFLHTARLAGLGLVASLAWATTAPAITIDFADYQGAAVGNQADISVDGYSIHISAKPSRFALSISDDGLGVRCTDGGLWCLTNSGSEIDSEWSEQIAITFQDGPVRIDGIRLSNLHLGESAVIDAGGKTVVHGRSLFRGEKDVALEDAVVETVVFSSHGLFSDVSIRGLRFTPGVAGPVRPAPSSPVPEPGAALLFGAGLLVVNLRRR